MIFDSVCFRRSLLLLCLCVLTGLGGLDSDSPQILFGLALANPRRESRMGRDVAALLQVLNNGVAKLWRMGNDFQLLWGNREFCRLTGHEGARSPRRRPERLDWNFLHPEDKTRLLALLPTLERELSPHTEEYRLNRAGWPCYALTLCCMWTEDDCAMYVCSLDSAASAWHQNDRLQWERRRFILLSTFANEILFEYSLSTDTLLHYDVLHTLFPTDEPVRPLRTYLRDMDIVHPDDLPLVLSVLNFSGSGPQITGKFRLRNRSGEFHWYQVQFIAMDYEDGRRSVLGRLMNVHESTEQLASLERSSSLDPLTGIFHKTAVQQSIDAVLCQPGPMTRSALLVIDLDNFKEVNDKHGHACGDEVIRHVVASMKACFRSSDIFGRVGGDEFVVLLRDIHNADTVQDKVQSFSQYLHEGVIASSPGYRCSVSIGVSLCPENGVTFKQLFRAADQAMYRAKREAKGSIFFA